MNRPIVPMMYTEGARQREASGTSSGNRSADGMEELRGSLMQAPNGRVDDLIFKTMDLAVPDVDIADLAAKVTRMRDINMHGGDMYVLDTEVLGGLGGPDELNKFNITEAALVRNRIGSDGSVIGSDRVHNVLFGISPNDVAYHQALVDKAANNWGLLNQGERAWLERLALYSGKDYRAGAQKPGQYRPIGLDKTADIRSVDAMQKGLNNLAYIGEVQGFNSPYGKQQIGAVTQSINSIGSDSLFLAHNGTTADVPWLNAANERLGTGLRIDTTNFLDTFEAANIAFDGDMRIATRYLSRATKKTEPLSGYGKQETWLKAAGIASESHLAVADSEGLFQVLRTSGFYNYIYEKMANVMKREGGSMTVGDGQLVYANEAVRGNGLDIFSSNGSDKGYMDTVLRRNNFYTVDGISTVQVPGDETTRQKMLEAGYDPQKPLYQMTLSNAAAGANEQARMYANDPKDFQKLFQGRLDVYRLAESVSKNREVTQDIVDRSYQLSVFDSTRRQFEKIFEPGHGKGFGMAKGLYADYQNLQSEARSVLGRDLTQGEMRLLMQEGVIENGGKRLTLNNQLQSLRNASGTLIEERGRNFTTMFDFLGQTHEVMGELIASIDKNTNAGDEAKTLALRNAWGEMTEGFEAATQMSVKIPVGGSLLEGHSLDLWNPAKSDMTRISVATRRSTANGIYRIAGSGLNKKDGLKTTQNAKRLAALESVGRDLVSNGIFKKDDMRYLFGRTRDPFYTAKAMAARLHDGRDIRTAALVASNSKLGVQGLGFNFSALYAQQAQAGNVYPASFLGEKSAVMFGGMERTQSGLTDAVKERLMAAHGYTQQNVDTLEQTMFSKSHGYVGKHGLSAFMFETEIDGRPTMHVAYGDQEGIKKSYHALASGRDITDATVFRLPSANIVSDGVRTVRHGNMEKLVTRRMNVWQDKNTASNDDLAKMRVSMVDTVDDAIRAQTKLHQYVPDMILDGRHEEAGRALYRDSLSPIINAKGIVGVETVPVSTNGGVPGLKKINLLTQGDFLGASQVDVNELVNFLPHVYTHTQNPGIRSDMDRLFAKDRGYDVNGRTTRKAKTAKQVLGEWESFARQGRDGMKTLDSLDPEQRAWFNLHLFRNHSLLEEISKLPIGEDLKQFDAVKALLAQKPNYLGKDEDVASGIAMTDNYLEYRALGEFDPLSRPVGLQELKGHAIFTDSPSLIAGRSLLDRADITVGKELASDRYLGYRETMRGHGMNIETSFSGNALMLDHEAIMARINGVDVDAAARETGMGKKAIQDKLNVFRTYSETAEGAVLVNPAVKRTLYPAPEISSIRFERNRPFFFNEGIGEGSYVDSGASIGHYLDEYGNKVDVSNPREAGFVQTVGNGQIGMRLANRQTSGMKLFIEGAEKGMAFGDFDLYLWDKIYGKRTAFVGNFDLSKESHASASVVFGSEVRKVIHQAKALGGDHLQGVADILNRHLPEAGFHVYDNGLSYAPNTSATGNYSGLYGAITEFRGMDAYKETLGTDYLRVTATKGRNSEFKSAADGDGGKGVKVNDRLLQSVGAQIGSDADASRPAGVDGSRHKLTEAITNAWADEVRAGEDYQKHAADLKNVGDALDMAAGGSASSAVPISMGEIGNPGSVSSADELRRSLYSDHMAKRGNVFALAVPENIKLSGPDGARVQDVYLPFMHMNVIEDIIAPSKSQKATNDFLRNLNAIIEGILPSHVSSMQKMQKMLDASYSAMLDAYAGEFTEKDGLLAKMSEGRLKHSGQVLIGQSIAPNIESDGTLSNKVYGGKVVDALGQHQDIVYTGKRMLKDMGVDFREIGQNLIDSDFAGRESFRDGLLAKRGSLPKAEALGVAFVRTEGIDASVFRHPTFKSTSHRAAKVRLNDSIQDRSVHMMSHTIQALNADHDGDNASMILNLTGTGGIKGSDDVTTMANEAMMGVQASDNAKWQQAAVDQYSDPTGTKKAYKVDDFVRAVSGEQDIASGLSKMNGVSIGGRIDTATVSKTHKNFIGYISTPNFYLKDVADQYLNRSTSDIESLKAIQQHVTDITEQKLIDVKHLSAFDTLTQAKNYSQALSDMANNDASLRNKGHADMLKVFSDAGFMDSSNEAQMRSGVDAISSLFSDGGARNAFNEAYQYKPNDTLQNLAQAQMIRNGKRNGSAIHDHRQSIMRDVGSRGGKTSGSAFVKAATNEMRAIVKESRGSLSDYYKNLAELKYMQALIGSPDSDKMDLARNVISDINIESPEILAHLGNVDTNNHLRSKAVLASDTYFTSSIGQDDLSFMRQIDALQKENILKDGEGGAWIAKYNAATKIKGAKRKQVSQDLVVQILQAKGIAADFGAMVDIEQKAAKHRPTIKIAASVPRAMAESAAGAMPQARKSVDAASEAVTHIMGGVKDAASVGGRYGATFAIGAAAATLALAAVSQGPLSPGRRPGKEAPDSNGEHTPEGPSARPKDYGSLFERKVYGNSGPTYGKYRVSATNYGVHSADQIAAAAGGVTGGGVNMSVRDDSSDMDDRWLQDQFLRLLNS